MDGLMDDVVDGRKDGWVLGHFCTRNQHSNDLNEDCKSSQTYPRADAGIEPRTQQLLPQNAIIQPTDSLDFNKENSQRGPQNSCIQN